MLRNSARCTTPALHPICRHLTVNLTSTAIAVELPLRLFRVNRLSGSWPETAWGKGRRRSEPFLLRKFPSLNQTTSRLAEAVAPTRSIRAARVAGMPSSISGRAATRGSLRFPSHAVARRARLAGLAVPYAPARTIRARSRAEIRAVRRWGVWARAPSGARSRAREAPVRALCAPARRRRRSRAGPWRAARHGRPFNAPNC